MTVERAVMLLYFAEFGYLNSPCLEKVLKNFNVFEFLEKNIYAFVGKISDRCLCWFPANLLVPISMGTSKASLYKSL